jgi:hypothetical protein
VELKPGDPVTVEADPADLEWLEVMERDPWPRQGVVASVYGGLVDVDFDDGSREAWPVEWVTAWNCETTSTEQ